MIILPAIDLYDKKAVRLYKGDYNKMTVYSENPLSVAQDFCACGATHIHLVDLQGAKSGKPENMEVIDDIVKNTGLFIEVGGGIRSEDTVKAYLDHGVKRVIIGTKAVTDPDFFASLVARYGESIAVGADAVDGYIAIKGWVEKSKITLDEFFTSMQSLGVKTAICTDISRDGAMKGTNLALYRDLKNRFGINVIASGGVSSMDDIIALKNMDAYGAIIGKAYYEGAIDLKRAVEISK
ncbi:MAG: 1-(5-phosphoribosyl)-5-[Clostridia bacterium]|nr:1-(5-phosphoribosyl)-5-[(5-phosphoribosylamino)methylideneamino]imidazole-4-carboxamide isomerase [Clostridia bacterium]